MEIDDSGKMKTKENSDLDNTWSQPPDANQEVDIDEEELNSIDNQLDELSNALDELEQKNDNIHAQLVRLLESNRQARKLFQEMQKQINENEKKENPNSA